MAPLEHRQVAISDTGRGGDFGELQPKKKAGCADELLTGLK